MNAYVIPTILLIVSNIFMTAAWYGHLKWFPKTAIAVTILISWGLAFFEYIFQVPANRLGYQAGAQAGQLKIIQEVITLVVFVIFARLVLGEKLAWNYYVAFALILAAVFFVFAFRQEPPHA
jgi:uncharacterized protein (DUF486 family)